LLKKTGHNRDSGFLLWNKKKRKKKKCFDIFEFDGFFHSVLFKRVSENVIVTLYLTIQGKKV